MVVEEGQQVSASWIWFEELSPGHLKCGFSICIYGQTTGARELRMTFKPL